MSDVSTSPPGRLSRALIRMLMKHARVATAETVSDGFRLITLESPEFKRVRWVPGQKVQIAMGSAFVARTFTPIEWDSAAGRTSILGYAHGSGPGSAWICHAQPGDACDVFGPRASLEAGDAHALVVIGDETSIGLARALQRGSVGTPVRCLLEVNSSAPVRQAVARLNLEGTVLVDRTPQDAHLEEIESHLPALASSSTTFMLTGKASTVQRLRRTLRGLGIPPNRLKSKAYWAPGKTGLD